MVIYAAANACIGATPAAYAADVMPSAVSGFGLGIYRCAGDIGMQHVCFVECSSVQRCMLDSTQYNQNTTFKPDDVTALCLS